MMQRSPDQGPGDVDHAAQRILDERAVELARNPTTTVEAGADIMLFRLGGEELAVEMAALRATLPARGLTEVPSTPPHIAGVLNIRGELVTILDLAALLGVPPAATAEDACVLLAEGPEGPVGFLVDEVVGMHQVSPEDLGATLSASGYTSGIGETRFSLLNLDQLFARAPLLVDDNQAPAPSEDTARRENSYG